MTAMAPSKAQMAPVDDATAPASAAPAPQPPGKPVVGLMGEFSAGKSTLTNLLLGEARSTVRVTATQLPPVWYVWGNAPAFREDLDGNLHPVDLASLDDVPVETTRYIKIALKSDILELLDLIDLPGNSDPSMSAEVWQRMTDDIDAVVWCSHATQAWRQSEAAVWEEVPDMLCRTSILLLTRFDKLLTDRDRKRVLARVRSETEDRFRAVLPISLIEALEAGEDREAWNASGADDFTRELIEMALAFSQGEFTEEPDQAAHVQARGPSEVAAAAPPVAEGGTVALHPSATPADAAPRSAVVPKRVAAGRKSGLARRRPPAEKDEDRPVA